MNTEPLAYPFNDRVALELDPTYRGLREHGLVRVALPYGVPAWLATRHEDVKTVLSDPRFSRARSVGPDEPRVWPVSQSANIIAANDPPDHTRLRALVATAFTKRGIGRLRPRIQQITDELLNGLARHRAPADLVALFAAPLPALVVCELLGILDDDRDEFVALADSLLTKSIATKPVEEIKVTGKRLWVYLAELVDRRRTEPSDDLVSRLVQARDADDRLSENEVVSLCMTVLIGGHDATTMQLGNFVYQLLTRPEHLALLRDEPALIPAAVEELMRYSPIGIETSSPRIATEDVRFGEIVVRAGEALVTAVGSANRDPAVFDDPEELDFRRPRNPHVGFGHGMRRCLGAELARVELQVALASLLRRFPGLRLAVAPGEVPWSTSMFPRSAQELLVAW